MISMQTNLFIVLNNINVIVMITVLLSILYAFFIAFRFLCRTINYNYKKYDPIEKQNDELYNYDYNSSMNNEEKFFDEDVNNNTGENTENNLYTQLSKNKIDELLYHIEEKVINIVENNNQIEEGIKQHLLTSISSIYNHARNS